LRFRRYISEGIIYMKTYCKNVVVNDVSVAEQAIHNCFKGKWKRREVRELLSRHCNYTPSQILQILKNGEKHLLNEAVHNLGPELIGRIDAKELNLPPTRSKTILDGSQKKQREIEVESYEHQIYDHMAVICMEELFRKKVGDFQCASIKRRGQIYAKKHIEKWLRLDPEGTRVAVKCDAKKYYQNVCIPILIKLLKRDIGKNKTLLWLVTQLLRLMKKGLNIGSYLSQFMANYYMSYLYHFAENDLFIIRRSKRKGNVKVRMISHILIYMDDVLLTGANRKYILMAYHRLEEYAKKMLDITFKPSWRFFYVDYEDKYGVRHGCRIDMVGFYMYRNFTVVRDHIFLKGRKAFRKVERYLHKGWQITIQMAHRVMSYYGWFKNSDMRKWSKKHNVEPITNYCKKFISSHDKSKAKTEHPEEIRAAA
jgi:RNA-directed DNA polymerase